MGGWVGFDWFKRPDTKTEKQSTEISYYNNNRKNNNNHNNSNENDPPLPPPPHPDRSTGRIQDTVGDGRGEPGFGRERLGAGGWERPLPAALLFRTASLR